CTHKSDPVLFQYAWDKPESPHVETRFIASKRLTRSQDAINRLSTENLLVNYSFTDYYFRLVCTP
nr:hypothetical protein [Nostoc sp. SerVER01]